MPSVAQKTSAVMTVRPAITLNSIAAGTALAVGTSRSGKRRFAARRR